MGQRTGQMCPQCKGFATIDWEVGMQLSNGASDYIRDKYTIMRGRTFQEQQHYFVK